MRITQLRQADLNLLVVFTALAEEKNVSRAAARLTLSQPAVSRALQRLRDMFRDDLLIRTASGWETTPKGQQLLAELSDMLPRLDRLLSGGPFDPVSENAHFRIAASDYGCRVVCPHLARTFLVPDQAAQFTFVPWGDSVYDEVDRGRLDLLLHGDDGHTPPHFEREVIFEEEFVCIVAEESGFPASLTMKQYLRASHIGIQILTGQQTIPERRLGEVNAKRRCVLWLPYLMAAMRCVRGTDLIVTVPRRLAEQEGDYPGLRTIGAPREMGRFQYMVSWHPRMSTDAAHQWLRSTMGRIGKEISHPAPRLRPSRVANRQPK